MATNIQTNKTFEQKLKERLKDSIGELLSDEELSKIIEKGMDETFFQPRQATIGYQTKYKDPLIVEILSELAKDRVNERVDQWLKDNPDKIQDALNKIVEDGVGMAVMTAMSNKFKNELIDFQNNIERSMFS